MMCGDLSYPGFESVGGFSALGAFDSSFSKEPFHSDGDGLGYHSKLCLWHWWVEARLLRKAPVLNYLQMRLVLAQKP